MTTLTQANSKTPIFYLLLPSARDVIFIFLFWSILAGTLSNRPLADPDIGWHIRNGERILVTHEITKTDPFSSTMFGHRWVAWEWLYDILLGILHRVAGLNGVVWLCALLVASTFTLLLTQLMKRGTGLLTAVVLMLLAEGASTIHLFARPHIASWVFLLLWFLALERWEAGSRPRWLPWFFPLSILIWVNIHGAWLLGLALLAIYTIASGVRAFIDSDPLQAILSAKRARAQGLAWCGSAVATLANPFGWHLHLHVYRYLSDRYLINRISEFHSPDFHGWAQRCFGILLLLTLISLSRRRWKIPISHFLTILFLVYVGLFSSRNLPISSMLLVLMIGPHLSAEVDALAQNPAASLRLRNIVGRIAGSSRRMTPQELQFRHHLWPTVCVVGALVICMQGGWVGSRHLLQAGFDPKLVPVAAVDFLESRPDVIPVFSTDSWGGYLIYRLYPSRQVVVDDRHDLFGTDRIRELLILMQGEPGWHDILNRWDIRIALLPADASLASLLRELPQEWQITYRDKVSVIFERR